MFTIEIPCEDRRIKKKKKKIYQPVGNSAKILLYIAADHRYIHPNIAQNIQTIFRTVNLQSDAIRLIAYIKGCVHEPLS